MFVAWETKEPEDLFHKAKNFFPEEKKVLSKKRSLTSFVVIFLFLLVISPIVFLGLNLSSSFLRYEEIQKSIHNQDLTGLEAKSVSLASSLSRTLGFLEFSSPLINSLGLEEKISRVQNFFLFGKNLAESLSQIAGAAQEGEKIFRKILAGETVSLEENLAKVEVELGAASERMALAQGFLSESSGREIFFSRFLSSTKTILPQVRRILATAQEIMEFVPEILGAKDRKTYLVLFQNNMEIRPGGGFIGSFGLLTFEKGRLLDFEIQDVYFADGQLKGHVEPPAKLKEFLGQAGWYLRDSNWDPDFPTSGQRAAWFLEKEIGRKVDGVMGVNLAVAQRLLEAVGEIELPDYQEKINAKNFFEKAEYYSEVGFFPGSTGKRDFLGQVARILFEKVKQADEKTLAKIGRGLLLSLEEKDLTIFFGEPKLAGLLARLNWDGGIKNAKCKIRNEKCLEDYLMVVEANVGVNKSNYFLKRALEQNIQIGEDGKITKRLVINYENQSPSEIFPAGKYKSYLRIYLPEGSILEKCRIVADASELQRRSDNSECQVDQALEHQRTVFGFLVEVPVKEKRKVEISWALPKTFEEGEYVFLFQKQPGSQKDSFVTLVSYPKTLSLEKVEPSVLTGEGAIVYNTILSSDFVLRVTLAKK